MNFFEDLKRCCFECLKEYILKNKILNNNVQINSSIGFILKISISYRVGIELDSCTYQRDWGINTMNEVIKRSDLFKVIINNKIEKIIK